MVRKPFPTSNFYRKTVLTRFTFKNPLFRVNFSSSSSTSTMAKKLNWKPLLITASIGCAGAAILNKGLRKEEKCNQNYSHPYNTAYNLAINKWQMNSNNASLIIYYLQEVQLEAINYIHPIQVARLTPYRDHEFFVIAHVALEKNIITVDEIFALLKNKKPHEMDHKFSHIINEKIKFLLLYARPLITNEEERNLVIKFISNSKWPSHWLENFCYLTTYNKKELTETIKILAEEANEQQPDTTPLEKTKQLSKTQSSLLEWMHSRNFNFPTEVLFKINTSYGETDYGNYLTILQHTIGLGYSPENCINQINKFSKFERELYAAMIYNLDCSFEVLVERQYDFGPKTKNQNSFPGLFKQSSNTDSNPIVSDIQNLSYKK